MSLAPLDADSTTSPTNALDVRAVGDAPLAHSPANMAVATLQAKLAYADVLARCSLLPKHLVQASNNAPLPLDVVRANVVLVLEYGSLLGVHPVTALTEIQVIEGKPGMSGKLMRTQLRKAGHKLRIWENSHQRADISIRLADDPESEKVHFEFTIQDAQTAKLCTINPDGKTVQSRSHSGKVKPWEAYTDSMLFERAVAKAIRALCPEILTGVDYTIDELQDMTADTAPIDPASTASTVEPEPVWPVDYADDTDISGNPKGAVFDCCGKDKAKARQVWDSHFAKTPPRTLGDIRQALAAQAAPTMDEAQRQALMDAVYAMPEEAAEELEDRIFALAKQRIAWEDYFLAPEANAETLATWVAELATQYAGTVDGPAGWEDEDGSPY